MLRYLADYIIIDCASVFEADPMSIVAIEMADRVLKLGTADLKGVSYYQTHNPMLSVSRFRKEAQRSAIGDLKVGQDWEAVSQQYGDVDYVLPHIAELEQQYSELTLFHPLTEKESTVYTTEIEKILGGVFVFQGVKTAAKAQPSSKAEKKAKPKAAGFKLPFAKNKGEF